MAGRRSFARERSEALRIVTSPLWSLKTTTAGPLALDIRFFGAPRLSVDGEPFAFRAPPRAMLLLAYLIAARGEVSRKSAAFALWPDDSEATALANLRRHLLLLEGALPPAPHRYLEKGRLWVRWCADDRCSVDTTRFEDAAADPARFEEAVACYTGDFALASENEWASAYRGQLRDRQFEVLDGLIARYRAAGDSARALDYAERAHRLDPWREDSLCDVMRLRTARGDRAGAVAQYLAFRQRVRDELGVDPLPQTTATYARISEMPGGGASAQVAPAEQGAAWERGSPYCGLRAFEVEDTPVFFGRAEERDAILEKLQRGAERGRPYVLVLGASGTGKSSIVRAGVIPALTKAPSGDEPREWRTLFLTPADGTVLAGLSAARAERGVRRLIVLDQLEQLFVGTPQAEIAVFLETLERAAANAGAWLILAMRSDFYHYVSEFPTLRALAESDSTYLLSALREEHVGQVIRGPAACAGIAFEVDPRTGIGLDEVIRRDAEGPGRLPLLEFALDELYLADIQRNGGRSLSFATYAALGGLAGAIAERARLQCADLERSDVETVLLSLITLRAGEAPTARTAPSDEFTTAPLRAVLDRLVEARLIVASGGPTSRTYRLAHEALLTHWRVAVELIDREAADLRALAGVRNAERLWRDRGCDDDFLLALGKPLAEARALQKAGRLLSPDLNAFLNASSARAELVERERETVEIDRKRLSRQARTARTAALLVGLAALALTGWGFTVAQGANRASAQRLFEQSITSDRLTDAWAACGKQRELCIASIEGWLNTNMPRLSNVSMPQVSFNYSVPYFSLSACRLEFEKVYVHRASGRVISREREAADLTELESIFFDQRGFNGGSIRPLLPTLIVQTQGFVKRSDAGYKYFYFSFDSLAHERLVERNFRLLADLCSDGMRVF